MAGEPNPAKPRPKAFDLLAAIASFALEHGIALNDPSLVERFIADAGMRLNEALSDRALLHGSRVEKLFEATILSLGQYRLLKSEDVGRVQAAGGLRAPDFRIVLDDGDQWLVEVKNVRSEKPLKQVTRMTASYLSSLQGYADMVGTPLKLAIYWSRWNLWTVISPDPFRRPNGGLRVKLEEAVMANELGRLGDMTIATKPPLRLVLGANTDMPRRMDADGMANFIIGSAKLFSGDVELLDPKDRQLAQTLLLYGDWPAEGPSAIMDDGNIVGVEFVAKPIEASDDGLDMIGTASRIFSSFYASQTIKGDEIVQLSGTATPEWFAPLAAWDFKRSKLPLWLFRQVAGGKTT